MLTKLLFSALASSLLFFAPVDAHVSIANPAPRGGATDSNNPPYNSQGTMWPSFPCQGKPAGPITATLNAGGTLHVDMVKHVAVHRGGHCQWAVSYDGGKTFVRIQVNYGNCPGLNKYVNGVEQNEQNDGTNSWEISIPADLPAADRAIFAWSWVPTVSGPAEYYMNCVDVKINGKSGSYTGPQLVVVNTPGTPLIQNDLNRLKSMIESAPRVTVSGSGGSAPAGNTGGNSCGGGSAPSNPPPSGGGSGMGASVGCPDGLCKSKWGFCGSGPAYCEGSATASVDDASDDDAAPAPVMDAPLASNVTSTRGVSQHSDWELWRRGTELVANLKYYDEEFEKLRALRWESQQELEQLESELQLRNDYDARELHSGRSSLSFGEEEEEEKPKHHHKKQHHKKHSKVHKVKKHIEEEQDY